MFAFFVFKKIRKLFLMNSVGQGGERLMTFSLELLELENDLQIKKRRMDVDV